MARATACAGKASPELADLANAEPHDALAVTLQCSYFAFRPVSLMFLLCFALDMPVPTHVPVLCCNAAAGRVAPREYRTRSVFLVWFAMRLRCV